MSAGLGCHAEAQQSSEIMALRNRDLHRPQQLLSSPSLLWKTTSRRCDSCAASLTISPHTCHMYISGLRGLSSTPQIAGWYFLIFWNRNSVQQRQSDCRKCWKASQWLIWQRLTCSSSHENSAPFQLTDIQGYIITISAAQSIWVSLHSNTDYGVVQSWAVLYRVSWLLQPSRK